MAEATLIRANPIGNLQPWQPGQSGNPDRKNLERREYLPPALRRYADKSVAVLARYSAAEEMYKLSATEAVAVRMWLRAALDDTHRGDAARQQLWDRLDGPVIRDAHTAPAAVSFTFNIGGNATIDAVNDARDAGQIVEGQIVSRETLPAASQSDLYY